MTGSIYFVTFFVNCYSARRCICEFLFCVTSDDNDLKEFDYERYLMEEVDLRGIVDNAAVSMVREHVLDWFIIEITNRAAVEQYNFVVDKWQ